MINIKLIVPNPIVIFHDLKPKMKLFIKKKKILSTVGVQPTPPNTIKWKELVYILQTCLPFPYEKFTFSMSSCQMFTSYFFFLLCTSHNFSILFIKCRAQTSNSHMSLTNLITSKLAKEFL